MSNDPREIVRDLFLLGQDDKAIDLLTKEIITLRGDTVDVVVNDFADRELAKADARIKQLEAALRAACDELDADGLKREAAQFRKAGEI